jgi:hypothetical protein
VKSDDEMIRGVCKQWHRFGEQRSHEGEDRMAKGWIGLYPKSGYIVR